MGFSMVNATVNHAASVKYSGRLLHLMIGNFLPVRSYAAQ